MSKRVQDGIDTSNAATAACYPSSADIDAKMPHYFAAGNDPGLANLKTMMPREFMGFALRSVITVGLAFMSRGNARSSFIQCMRNLRKG